LDTVVDAAMISKAYEFQILTIDSFCRQLKETEKFLFFRLYFVGTKPIINPTMNPIPSGRMS
jgi:hypothetical protein